MFVIVGIQHAMRMLHNFHLWPILIYHIFPRYLIKVTIFERKITERKMRVLIFSTTFV